MLTQIEWWGGVIFVLGALTYRMVMGALERPTDGIPWYRLMMHVFFLARPLCWRATSTRSLSPRCNTATWRCWPSRCWWWP